MKNFLYFLTVLSILVFYQCDNLQNLFEIKKPKFKVEYKNNSYEIEMSAGTNGMIFYTLDGSNPTNNSIRYDNPINLPEGSYIKSISYCPGGRKSKISEIALNSSTAVSAQEQDLSLYKCQTLK